MEQQEDKLQVSADGKGSGRNAPAGKMLQIGVLEKRQMYSPCQLWEVSVYCRLCVVAKVCGSSWLWGLLVWVGFST